MVYISELHDWLLRSSEAEECFIVTSKWQPKKLSIFVRIVRGILTATNLLELT